MTNGAERLRAEVYEIRLIWALRAMVILCVLIWSQVFRMGCAVVRAMPHKSAVGVAERADGVNGALFIEDVSGQP